MGAIEGTKAPTGRKTARASELGASRTIGETRSAVTGLCEAENARQEKVDMVAQEGSVRGRRLGEKTMMGVFGKSVGGPGKGGGVRALGRVSRRIHRRERRGIVAGAVFAHVRLSQPHNQDKDGDVEGRADDAEQDEYIAASAERPRAPKSLACLDPGKCERVFSVVLVCCGRCRESAEADPKTAPAVSPTCRT